MIIIEELTDFTSIQVSEDVRAELEKRKVHPRQSYNEVLKKVLKLKEE